MTACSDQMTPSETVVCVCGHVLDDHREGHHTWPCDVINCDCDEFEERES